MWGDGCIGEPDGGIWFTIYVYIKSSPCTLLKIQLVQPKYIQFSFMNHTSVKLGWGTICPQKVKYLLSKK